MTEIRNSSFYVMEGYRRLKNAKNLYQCKFCNPQDWYTTEAVKRGVGCRSCNPSKHGLHTTERYGERLEKLGKALQPIGVYKGISVPIEHKCLSCGALFTARPSSVLAKRGLACNACSSTRFYHSYTLGSRVVQVQGYEDLALDWLLHKKGVDPSRIRVFSDREVPVVYYQLDGKNRRNYPDLFLPDRNILIEVKSLHTAGLTNHRLHKSSPDRLWHILCAKARQTMKDGFIFRLLVMQNDNGSPKRIVLPRGWYRKTRTQILKGIHHG